jgi:hypothetical protein
MEKPLHINIAAIPNTEYGNPKLLEHDLRLTKASILYADRVKLCSLTAWLATSFHLIGNLPMTVNQQFEILMSFAPAIISINPDSINLTELQKLQQLLKKNPILLTRKERLKISRFRDMFPEIWKNLGSGFGETLSKFGFDEIELAANQGLLEIQPFSKITSEEFPFEYLSIVEDLLSNSSTNPLLDEQTNDLVRLALKAGKISISNASTRRGKQIGLVADLFDHLPVFDIKMDELLDIRKELQNPLVRFRAEMVNLSIDIETASWDKDFPADVQNTYQAKIEPTLLEIEEKLKSTSFRDFWSRRFVDKYAYLAGTTAISYALGATVSPLIGIASAFVAAGIFTEAGFSELIEKRREIERNGIYFYYQVKNHISKK